MTEPLHFPDMPSPWTVHFDDRNSSKNTSFYDLKEDGHPTHYYFLYSHFHHKWRMSGGDYISNHWPLVDTPAEVANQLRAHLLAIRMGVPA